MDNQHFSAAYYAILIGINAYPPEERSINGCVEDVQDIKAYLEGTSDSVQIRIFTATKSANSASYSPAEDPTLWPTYRNVRSAFENVISQARSGDFVYIHFSGHGTWMSPDDEFSNRCTGDLALVLLSRETKSSLRYLPGSELAFFLNEMMHRGLIVTVVLDCCFSANVYRRDDPDIRYLPYSPESDPHFSPDPEQDFEDEIGGPATRGASMLPNWLIKSNGYATLVACGPHEIVKPIILKDGGKRGGLSYFLLRAFIESGALKKKHKHVYHHLCALFREHHPEQNPVLYGNKDQGFFGHAREKVDGTSIPVVERNEGLQLQAGQAHGIRVEDQFALISLGSTGCDPDLQENIVIAKVVRARALTSDLELMDTKSTHPQTGWIAKHLTRISLRRFPIRLAPNLPCQDVWQTALEQRSLDIHADGSKSAFSFHILLNSSQEYEILNDSDQKITNVPPMPQKYIDIHHICDILEHLAGYTLVRDLANMSANPFQESFSVQIINRAGLVFNPGCLLTVEHSEKEFTFELQVENKGYKTLYVYFYSLESYWQIYNIYRGTYKEIPPQDKVKQFTGILSLKMKTAIPVEMREKGYNQCDDVIKVFVTSQPTSFDLLELPKLNEQAVKRTISRTIRGNGNESSEDWAVLSALI